MEKSIDIWNETIKIRDKYNQSTNDLKKGIASHAGILLAQMNTAGGMELMRSEVENFIYKYK